LTRRAEALTTNQLKRAHLRSDVVEARAFKGLEFDATKVELAKVIAPPYDVINATEREQLRKKSPNNITHLTLPKVPRSSKEKDPHEYANRLLEEWIASGVLKEAPEEALYAVEIWHTLRHQERRMRGVILGVRVDPTYKQVVPHERIFDKPAEERLKLLRATATDLEPIWLLYSGKTVEETLWAYIDGGGMTPDLLVTAPDGAIHRFWRVMDAAVIGTVLEGLKGRKTYIADGHHRYATAVKYAEERRMREYRPSRAAAYEFKMSLLVNMNDAGLSILPTHRVIKAPKKLDLVALRERLGVDFQLEEREAHLARLSEDILDALQKEAASAPHVFALYGQEGNKFWILRAKENVLPEALSPGRSFTWRTLDVSFLQKSIVEKHLGIPEERWGDDVYYTRDAAEAAELVQSKKASLALFHLPTKMQQLRAIADGGEVMPQKSTFFVPKPVSGIVLYRIGKAVPQDPNRRRHTS
jgi:uncharacterized protein (DUF1015 family)